MVLIAHYLLAASRRAQVLLLLVASYGFYGYWDPRFLSLLLASTLVDFVVSGKMEQATPSRRKWLLGLSIVTNLSALGIFKYYDFFVSSFARVSSALGLHFAPPLLEVVLPVGISFYTFQSLAYTIDVYRGNTQPCRDFPLFALYISYFPQLVAGPIERAKSLLPQLRQPRPFSWSRTSSGAILMVLGLFKKTVLGDSAGYLLVDPAYQASDSGVLLWVGTFAFAIQIYGDFSGYCDIARGVSRCLGVEITENFRAPYFSSDITQFWRRWHITLSSWFRDYLYIPLGGNRRGPLATYRNLALTMVLCGLWHGAGLNFILWGCFHGGLLLVHRATTRGKERPPLRGVHRVLSVTACFVLVCYGWMLFRIEDSSRIWEFTQMMLWPGLPTEPQLFVRQVLTLAILGLGTAFAHWLQIQDKEMEEAFEARTMGLLLGCMLVAVLLFGSLGEPLPFIYFQF